MSQLFSFYVAPGQRNAIFLGDVAGAIPKAYCSTSTCGGFVAGTDTTIPDSPPAFTSGSYVNGIEIMSVPYQLLWFGESGDYRNPTERFVFVQHAATGITTAAWVQFTFPDSYLAALAAYTGSLDKAWHKSGLYNFPALDLSHVTDFRLAWSECRLDGPSGFPSGMDLSAGIDFTQSWLAAQLDTFPALDLSNGTAFIEAWAYNSITTFATTQLGAGVDFTGAWKANVSANLSLSASIDLSSGVNFTDAWRSSSLRTMPGITLDAGETFTSAWESSLLATVTSGFAVPMGETFTRAWRASALTTFPVVAFDAGETFTQAWENCATLAAFGACTFPVATSFDRAWSNCALTSFGACTFGGADIDFSSAWADNALTSFPSLDLTEGVDFYSAWQGNNLTSFPSISLAKGTDFKYAWDGNALTSFPAINLSAGIEFDGAWRYNALTSFPAIAFASGASFISAWKNNQLTSFSSTSFTGADLKEAWQNNALASFPVIASTGCTDINSAWKNNALTAFPSINLASVTDARYAWADNVLTTFPPLNLSAATTLREAWRNNSLQTFPSTLVGVCDDFRFAWSGNPIVTFPLLSFKQAPIMRFENAWDGCVLNPTSVENVLTALVNTQCTMIQTVIGTDGTALTTAAQASLDVLETRGCIIQWGTGGIPLYDPGVAIPANRWRYLLPTAYVFSPFARDFLAAHQAAYLQATLDSVAGPYTIGVYASPFLAGEEYVPANDAVDGFRDRFTYNAAQFAPTTEATLLMQATHTGSLTALSDPVEMESVASGLATHVRITGADGSGVCAYEITPYAVNVGEDYLIKDFVFHYGEM